MASASLRTLAVVDGAPSVECRLRSAMIGERSAIEEFRRERAVEPLFFPFLSADGRGGRGPPPPPGRAATPSRAWAGPCCRQYPRASRCPCAGGRAGRAAKTPAPGVPGPLRSADRCRPPRPAHGGNDRLRIVRGWQRPCGRSSGPLTSIWHELVGTKVFKALPGPRLAGTRPIQPAMAAQDRGEGRRRRHRRQATELQDCSNLPPTPGWMVAAHRQHRRLQPGRWSRRAGVRPTRPIHQPCRPFGRKALQPVTAGRGTDPKATAKAHAPSGLAPVPVGKIPRAGT
jgi:hypothetical protein